METKISLTLDHSNVSSPAEGLPHKQYDASLFSKEYTCKTKSEYAVILAQ